VHPVFVRPGIMYLNSNFGYILEEESLIPALKTWSSGTFEDPLCGGQSKMARPKRYDME
jgi:hypothetical protein